MAFYLPRFNVWCRVWRKLTTNTNPIEIGYSICQVRGPEGRISPPQGQVGFEVLFPKWSDVRGFPQGVNGDGDFIQVAGWGPRTAQINSIADKGAGFANEYRVAVVGWVNFTDGLKYNKLKGAGPVEPTLLPPDGYTPLPLIDPEASWPSII